VLGQYFNVSDVIEIFEFNLESQDTNISDWIKSMDVYQFLIAQDGGSILSDSYYFRHVTIMNAIYQSITFEERSLLHELAAIYFERLYTETDTDVLLPVTSFHYSKTNHMVKNIEYMEKLG
jgi:hypothetical protein